MAARPPTRAQDGQDAGAPADPPPSPRSGPHGRDPGVVPTGDLTSELAFAPRAVAGDHSKATEPGRGWVPEQIGEYVVERELGRGGMGVVFLAMDPRLKRRVAIKSLPPDRANDPAWKERLSREAERLASLNHPHIALIFERLDTDDGNSYLVMEYVEGESVRDRLRARPLSVRDGLQLCTQVALGLEAAHHRGIIHRDIKPENIQVAPPLHAKILDFGIAVDTDPGVLGQEGTSEGDPALVLGIPPRTAGTPGYSSPEQVRGRAVDRRADIFAFGCLAFECLAGRPAFTGATAADRVAAVLQEEPDWDLLPSEVPTSVRELLEHCLEKPLVNRLRDIGDARYTLARASNRGGRMPATPVAPIPNNLPPEMMSFIGRAEVLERLRVLLVPRGTSAEAPPDSHSGVLPDYRGAVRLLTIAGGPGCGKTTIALRLASSIRHAFPGGVWFVDLSGVESEERIPEVIAATVLRESSSTPRSVPDLQRALSQGRSLLLLDNCEHLLRACGGLVRDLLRTCETLTVLATSRETLGLPGEQAYLLPALGLPPEVSRGVDRDTRRSESVALFVDRACLVQPNFDPKGDTLACVARICQKLDGIPLAIELAAARLRLLTPQQIESRLDDRFKLLAAGTAAVAGRHDTLWSAIDWSYRLLTREDRQALHRLEVFAGGLSLEAATAVLETSDYGALEILGRLVEKSLVVADAGAGEQAGIAATRYRLYESLREFLRAQRQRAGAYRGSGIDPVSWGRICDLHLAYFEQLARAAALGIGANPGHWTPIVVAERSNLLAAQRHALGPYHPGNSGVELTNHLRRIWDRVFRATTDA